MQPDSHPGPTESDKNASATREVTASSGPRALRSAVAAWAGVFGLAALPLVSCGDDDSTGVIARGGSGGTAGAAGSAGSGAGTGGSAGSAGAAGAAGASGAAGAAGSGGDPFDGAAVAAAICATMGQLASSADPDAGADAAAPDAGDAGPAAPTGCTPAPTCAADLFTGPTGAITYIQENVPACVDEMEAYHNCMAAQPVSAYECGLDGLPTISLGNHGCVAEENAFYTGLGDESSCE